MSAIYSLPSSPTYEASMKHPFQIVTADAEGKHIFGCVQNSIYVFDAQDGHLLGLWSDAATEPATKKAKTNDKDAKDTASSSSNNNGYIRTLTVSRNGQHVIGTTDHDKAAVIFRVDFSQANCLSLVKRQTFPKRPCAASTTIDDAQLVVADKFGDVYSIPIDGDATPEKELEPIMGHVSMLTDVKVAEHNKQQFIITGDRDEHVRVTHFPEAYVIKHWLFGHGEFVSCLYIASFDESILISGGGDEYVVFWDWCNERKLATVPLREHVESFLNDAHLPPERYRTKTSEREICVSNVVTLKHSGHDYVIVLCENTACLLVFEVERTADGISVAHKQTFATDASIVDFVVCGDHVVASMDKHDDDVVEVFNFNGTLTRAESSLEKAISDGNKCNVASVLELSPLYYIHTLRKRSDH